MKRFIMIFTLVILCGCTKTVYLDSNGNEIENQNTHKTMFQDQFIVIKHESSATEYYELRHIETGVHYIWVRDYVYGGLSPLYESDGAIRVTK